MREVESDLCAERPTSSPGVYLYCFARRAITGRIEAPGFEDQAQVTCLTVGEIAAVFSDVPLESFSGPTGDANLRDASWIVPRARRHEQVVEEVMRSSPVLPARFGTVLSSRATLERLAARNAKSIEQFLDQMADREEWSVKAFLDMRQAETWLLASQAAPDAVPGTNAPSPGLRYIQARRLVTQTRQQLGDWRRRTAEEIERSLATHAVDVRPLRLHAGETPGETNQMILHDAMLVLKEQLDAWRACAGEIEARHTGRGLSLSISGPWPPYSFCPAVFDVEPGP